MSALEAMCQSCRKTAKRGWEISHGPRCTLPADSAECLEADLTRPCRFAGTCHEERRRIAVGAGLRGEACYFFAAHVARIGPDPAAVAERQAIQQEGA
jgi:hypothetical protein